MHGRRFYLYLLEDLFSRKAVGCQVFTGESAKLASQLLQSICHRAGIKPDQPTVHSDTGGPMKGQTMLTTLQKSGVAHSRSRPAVSNDHPYAQSLFKTLKYRPRLTPSRSGRQSSPGRPPPRAFWPRRASPSARWHVGCQQAQLASGV